MGSRELYSSVVTPKRKYTWGHDVLAANLNSAVAPIEGIVGNNFYDPKVGSKDAAKMMIATDKAGRIANAGFFARMGKGKGAGASAVMQGASEMGKGMGSTASVEQQSQINKFAKAGVETQNTSYFIDPAKYGNPSPAGLTNSTGTFAQNQLQNQFGDQYSKLGTMNAGPQYMADGGMLTRFKGNSHENGGIPLGKDNVENNETMFSMDNQSDFIFSDRILYPKSKESFATKSKRIESKYKLRPNDPYGKKSQERELNRLATEQEVLKSTIKPKDTTVANHMAYGGDIYANGGEWNPPTYEEYLIQQGQNTATEFDKPQSFLSTDYRQDNGVLPITKMTAKGMPTASTLNTLEGINNPAKQEEPVAGAYKSNFLPTALGYAAQAASNLPAMFMKPDLATFSRVKFQPTSLAEARNEARRSRNLGLATAKGIGANSNDIGQVMNYLSGTTAALNSQYGSLFNQSLMGEANANSELNMREQLANSEVERYQEGINTAEEDAIRNLKMQGAMNMGTAAAMAGKDYMVSQGADAQINALMASNPDYTYKIVDGKLVPIRLRAMGGKRGKA